MIAKRTMVANGEGWKQDEDVRLRVNFQRPVISGNGTGEISFYCFGALIHIGVIVQQGPKSCNYMITVTDILVTYSVALLLVVQEVNG